MRQSIAAATSHAHRSIGIGIISSKYRGKKEGKNEADKKKPTPTEIEKFKSMFFGSCFLSVENLKSYTKKNGRKR